MFFILKKKAIIAAFMCLVILIGLSAYFTVQATAVPKSFGTIVIDAGHGGIDAGVTGKVTSVKESEINLCISKYLKGYLSDAGFNVIMTRTTQGGLYGVSTKGFKMRDMKKRKQIIEDSGADMVISIHQNFCPIASKRGGTVFFDKDSDCGKLLAKSIQNSINGMKECVTRNEALVGDYYMLKCTKSPSVIVECGFLSNSEDEALLVTSEYQKSIAYAVFRGAVAYYS